MTPSTTEALKIVAENEWMLGVNITPPLSHSQVKTLFAAIKQLSGDGERYKWLKEHGELKHVYEEGRPDDTIPVIQVDAFTFDFDNNERTLDGAIDAAIRKDNQ